MHDYRRLLGDTVKLARERLGISQRKLAELAGIDSRTMLEIENNRGNPTLEILFPIVRVLHLDVREVFFPELLRESPKLAELRLIIENCSEEEAIVMIEVFTSVLNAIRNKNTVNLI